jgi:hypothetical protein
MKLRTAMFFSLIAIAAGLTGCKPKEPTPPAVKTVPQPESMQISGQVFVVTKDSRNIVLGGVEITLFDEQAMLSCINSNLPQWSNKLAAAAATVIETRSNYDALYQDDLAKLEAAQQYHKNVMLTNSQDSINWLQAEDWVVKLQGQIDDLNMKKEDSETGKALTHAIDDQDFDWNYINWPETANLQTAGCSTDHWQNTMTDAEGRFKFLIPASSPNMVLMVKAERQEGDNKEKYLWLEILGTPTGEANLDLLANPHWLPSVQLGEKPAEINLSNDNVRQYGLWEMLEDTNARDYMLSYQVSVEHTNAGSGK